jgi:hypothetical protein
MDDKLSVKVYIQHINKNMILFTIRLMLEWNFYYHDYRPYISKIQTWKLNLKGNVDDYN